MVKQKIYVIDTKKSTLSGSVITDYDGVASGGEFLLKANNVSMTFGKASNPDTNLGRFTSTGFYKEGIVQSNSVANRVYSITGIIDNKESNDKIMYKYLLQMIKAPSIFAIVNELTKYADAPHDSTYTSSNLSTNIVANEYQYVVFKDGIFDTSADDNNIINFSINAVLVND